MTSAATLVLAVLVALVLTPAVRRVPGLVAIPLPTRWSQAATPTTGGIALFGAFLLALQPALLLGAVDRRYIPLILGAGAAFALGLWDDGRPLGRAASSPPRWRSRSSPAPRECGRTGCRWASPSWSARSS